MGADDCFREGGAGSRHAHDENRFGFVCRQRRSPLGSLRCCVKADMTIAALAEVLWAVLDLPAIEGVGFP